MTQEVSQQSDVVTQQEPVDRKALIQEALASILELTPTDKLIEEIASRHENVLVLTVDDRDGDPLDNKVNLAMKGNAFLLAGAWQGVAPSVLRPKSGGVVSSLEDAIPESFEQE